MAGADDDDSWLGLISPVRASLWPQHPTQARRRRQAKRPFAASDLAALGAAGFLRAGAAGVRLIRLALAAEQSLREARRTTLPV